MRALCHLLSLPEAFSADLLCNWQWIRIQRYGDGHLRSTATGKTVAVGEGVALHHPWHAIVDNTVRIKIDNIPSLIIPQSTLTTPATPI